MLNENKIVKTIKESSSPNQIICFPFVGGHWAVFKELGEMLTADIDVLAINPPGRMGNETKLINNIDEMSDLYLSVLKDRLKENTIFFGYSLGSIVSYDLLKKLRGIKTKNINSLHVVSASLPPHLIKRARKITELPNDKFIGWLNMLGGIPKMLMDDKELLDYFTPVLKADYKAFEDYKSEIESLGIDAHIIAGSNDFFSSPDKMEEWGRYYNNSKEWIINGGHMFIKENTIEFAKLINDICDQFISANDKQKVCENYTSV